MNKFYITITLVDGTLTYLLISDRLDYRNVELLVDKNAGFRLVKNKASATMFSVEKIARIVSDHFYKHYWDSERFSFRSIL